MREDNDLLRGALTHEQLCEHEERQKPTLRETMAGICIILLGVMIAIGFFGNP